MTGTTRRRFMSGVAGAGVTLPLGGFAWAEAASASDPWNAGDLVHLLPTASHDRFLIKCSFASPRDRPPVLLLAGRRVEGVRGDTRGYFWRFDAAGLKPGTRYTLRLLEDGGVPLTDPWPLKTLPDPARHTKRLRILAYTCGGGDEQQALPDGTPIYLSLDARQRLLGRGLSLAPDVVIANGDHVYYDQRAMLVNKPPSVIAAQRALLDRVGTLDAGQPIFGTPNEELVRRVGDSQIARLYGVALRSTPVFFLTDDHDLFDNDEATDDFITLPPDPTYLAAARAIQHLYYPEFLPDTARPLDLPGSSAPDRASGLSEVYGTLRYGDLFEAVLYDTKRYANVGAADGYMVPPAVEDWLLCRTRARDTAHLVHIPSTPMGWSAGKWGEWYPDVLQSDGRLGVAEPKPYWPESWWHQHQRLLAALGAQQGRAAVVLSGDLHQFSAGRLLNSGDLDFSGNPVHCVVAGPLGSGAPAFPSAARGVVASVPGALTMDQHVPPLEKNGFTLIDVTRRGMAFTFYAWRPPQPLTDITALPPAHSFRI